MNSSRRRWGLHLVLAAALLLALIVGSVNTVLADAMVARELPDYGLKPGETFDVIITFTAPSANTHAVVLFDEAPSGWAVQVDKTWCTPEAQTDKTYGANQAEYTWLGPYGQGETFTAVYRVTVPAGAAPGPHTFPNGQLLYYVTPHPASPVNEAITADNQVQVEAPRPPTAGMAYPVWIVLIAGLAAGAFLLVLRRRRVRA